MPWWNPSIAYLRLVHFKRRGNENNLQIYKISMYAVLLGDRIKSAVVCMCFVDWLVALKSAAYDIASQSRKQPDKEKKLFNLSILST